MINYHKNKGVGIVCPLILAIKHRSSCFFHKHLDEPSLFPQCMCNNILKRRSCLFAKKYGSISLDIHHLSLCDIQIRLFLPKQYPLCTCTIISSDINIISRTFVRVNPILQLLKNYKKVIK